MLTILLLIVNKRKGKSFAKITNDDRNRLYSWITYVHWHADELDNDNTLRKIIDVYFNPNDTTSDDPALKLVRVRSVI